MTLSVPCPIATVEEIYSSETKDILRNILKSPDSENDGDILAFTQKFTRHDFVEGLAIRHALVKGARGPIPLHEIWSRMTQSDRGLIAQLQLDEPAFNAIDMSSGDFEDNLDVTQFRASYFNDAIVLTANRPTDVIDNITGEYTEASLSKLITVIVPRARSNHEALKARPHVQKVVDLCNKLLGYSNGADELRLEIPEGFDQTK